MYQGRETDLTHTKSVCMDCSGGCYRVGKTRDNRLVRVDGDMDATFADSLLCEKGRYEPVKENRLRVTQPLIRRDGEFLPIDWDHALNVVSPS
jgi:predicted molibdopterin-dependent oxidoreductase YjgC